MAGELPIACSLSATELPTRVAEMAALGAEALREVHHAGSHAELRFADTPGVRDRVALIVTAESKCCAFLAMRVSDAPGVIVLTVDAPDGAEPALREWLDAF
jgi:hypothetical protein